MGAKMPVFAEAVEMRSGDAIDDLGIGCGVFEDPSFKLKELGNVTGRGRIVS